MLATAAIAEGLTGLALILVPSLAGRLLLGEDLAGLAVPVARVAGIALASLAFACWSAKPLPAMLGYSTAIAVYLAYLGLAGLSGPLLWPAVVVHLIMSVLLGRTWLSGDARSGA